MEDNMKKRTIHIDGIKLGYKGGLTLLDLVNKQISLINKSDKNKPFIHGDKFEQHKSHLIGIGNSIHEYLAQWDNIQLGDKVEYKPNIIVMKNLFEPKPEPEPKKPEQLELNLS
tara:strand:+ start:91 stop:432 length:342 start_codon:yes stop_codon:yes gene_type:complete